MIQTNKGVYPTRNGELLPVHIEILAIEDDFNNNVFKMQIADFIVENEQKKYINNKSIFMPYQNRDALKSAILKKLDVEGTESEVNKFLLPHALLYSIVNDIVNKENSTLVYGTKKEDWEISKP